MRSRAAVPRTRALIQSTSTRGAHAVPHVDETVIFRLTDGAESKDAVHSMERCVHASGAPVRRGRPFASDGLRTSLHVAKGVFGLTTQHPVEQAINPEGPDIRHAESRRHED